MHGVGQDPDQPPYASWARRVVAYLLDTAVVGGVAFLAAGATSAPAVLPGLSSGAGAGVGVDDSAWLALTVLGLALLQAYTGATPGKRVAGIVVVRQETGRPAGIVTTVLRWLAHVVDCVLLIGYLRPLWHPQRKTFADSMLSTVVLHRTRPDAARPLARRRASALVTAAAVVLCGTGAAFALGPTSTASSSWVTGCDPAPTADSTTAPLTFVSVEADFVPTTVTATRWGVTRSSTDPDPSTPYGSGWTGLTAVYFVDAAAGTETHEPVDADLVLAVQDVDGAPVSEEASTFRVSFDAGGSTWQQIEGTTSAGSVAEAVNVPEAALDGLAPGWTWRASLRVDGQEVASCAGAGAGASDARAAQL
nr:RDD family protein [Cellulosimicrobium arenosum]